MSTPVPSGRQLEISHGGQRATVVEVGGGLRQYHVNGREVLDRYGIEERCTAARGLPLVPWPNRIADGQYSFGGHTYQLPLTEPEKNNAIHGLLRWRNWSCQAHEVDRVRMAIRLYPMMGYPFTLDVEVEYQLADTGLTVSTTATNRSDEPCPYAAGQHPYISSGPDRVDQCHLQFDATQWLPTDTRGIPTGIEHIEGSPVDFRAGRLIGSQDIDYTFTDLHRDAEGLAWVNITGPHGQRTSVWLDEHYPYLEIFTSHTLASRHWRTGLGVEPMTAPPNGFRTGIGVLSLEPGQSVTSLWGMQAD
ncbi:aldose 1-epimerase [Mycobacterium sp. OAS707]|uniref:aldose 1-epimerase family protein n=1 Tax=Mycobacterium sp. OAS707 TaxID=2663822 RepID=UPI00178A1BF4|nr:aldose 1-epimerase family protein [Mycobacterium sp. OAS707]MBE1552186.1 aldose 1-epimerase [Mycobacterium sp. OAS707]